jgi:prophage antirepressor-like protein
MMFVAYDVCRIIGFGPYDVCRIIGFVAYDVCRIIGFVPYDVCRIMTFVAHYDVCQQIRRLLFKYVNTLKRVLDYAFCR